MESIDLHKSGIRWFYHLIPNEKNNRSLYDNYSEREISQGVLVCGFTSRDRRIFALFPNHIAFSKFNVSLSPEKRCFFEIILGSIYQKPHFDVDVNLREKINYDPDEFFFCFISHLITRFKEIYGINLSPEEDLLIFTSHGKEKRSYHVIIDNYCHTGNKEARAFYDKVMEDLPSEYKSPVVDDSVYSSKQQFRIVGSQKKGSGRVKTLLREWSLGDNSITYKHKEKPHNERHENILMLEASLISYTRDCTPLPCLITEEEKPYNTTNMERDELSQDSVKAVINLLISFSQGNRDKFPYEFKESIDNLILLKRLYPSRCRICKRVHEHENPYLLVITDENLVRHVYFDCRRADGRKLYIGILPDEYKGQPLTDSPMYQDNLRILEKLKATSNFSMKGLRSKVRNTLA